MAFTPLEHSLLECSMVQVPLSGVLSVSRWVVIRSLVLPRCVRIQSFSNGSTTKKRTIVINIPPVPPPKHSLFHRGFVCSEDQDIHVLEPLAQQCSIQILQRHYTDKRFSGAWIHQFG